MKPILLIQLVLARTVPLMADPSKQIVGKWIEVGNGVVTEYLPDGTFIISRPPDVKKLVGKWEFLPDGRLRFAVPNAAESGTIKLRGLPDESEVEGELLAQFTSRSFGNVIKLFKGGRLTYRSTEDLDEHQHAGTWERVGVELVKIEILAAYTPQVEFLTPNTMKTTQNGDSSTVTRVVE